MAYDHELSPEQEEVFLLKLAEQKKYDEIATQLGISKVACLKRMAEVYKKFNIIGETRGKENRLRIFLNQEFQKNVPKDDIHKLIEAVNVRARQQRVPNIRSSQQESTSEQALNNPCEWIRELRQKLVHGKGMCHTQQVLREFAALLPEVVERVAATSQRTELDISLEILDKVEFVLQIQDSSKEF